MGACQCKNCTSQDEDRSNLSAYDVANSSRSNSILANNSPLNRDRCNSNSKRRSYTPKSVDSLILQTLNMIGKLGLVGYNHEPPEALQKLHIIGDQEEGWLQIIMSMIYIVPVDDPLGPAVITVVLEDCPLPNKETVLKLTKLLNLTKYTSYRIRRIAPVHCHRNICVILGVLAEKLPGPSSVAMLTPKTLEYLIFNLDHKKIDSVVTLFSLIALEKFAQITENKIVIKNYLDNEQKNPLLRLENLIKSENYVESQVGFCARWLLDNICFQVLIQTRKEKTKKTNDEDDGNDKMQSHTSSSICTRINYAEELRAIKAALAYMEEQDEVFLAEIIIMKTWKEVA
ncbi:hypothetical protein PGB90_000792 [Kerria lacca]